MFCLSHEEESMLNIAAFAADGAAERYKRLCRIGLGDSTGQKRLMADSLENP